MDDHPPATLSYPFPAPPEPGAAVEVAPGILWLRFPLPMALDHVNVYALDDGDGWTVIATGIQSRRSREIWGTALQGPLACWRGAGTDAALLDRRMAERPFNFADTVAPLPLGFTRIQEGQTLTAGGRDWTVRIGNGHAPEHATLWSEDIVIGGDQLLPSISPNLGVYATEPLADPVADWRDSGTRLSAFATADQLVLPGHKLPFRGLPTRLNQLIDNHHGALQRLQSVLATPHTAAECFQTLFMRQIGEGEYGLALVEAMAHVLHLWHAGRVTRRLGEDGAWLWQAKD